MTLTIGTNIASLKAQTKLAENDRALGKVTARLSSGLRINSASDDAAGLAAAEGLKVDKLISAQGTRNANDAGGALNTIDSALSEMKSILERVRELAVQAENGSLNFSQRAALDTEADALAEEYNRIYASVEFNGKRQIEVDQSLISIQLGGSSASYSVGDSLERNIGDGTFSDQGGGIYLGGLDAISIDIDADGDLDVITAKSSLGLGDEIEVVLNNGQGVLSPGGGGQDTTGDVYSINAGDINGDGIIDIVAGLFGSVQTYIGQGDGTFSANPSSSIGAGFGITNLELNDTDGDGDLDIVGTNQVGTLFTSLNDGAGNFAATTLVAAGSFADIALGDIDGDGDMDLFASSSSAGTTSIFRNDGGSYSLIRNLTGIATADAVSVSDLNNDGYADLTVQGGSSIGVYLTIGEASFDTGNLYSTPGSLVGGAEFDLADMDGDGFLDILTSEAGAESFGISYNNGDGTFGDRETTVDTNITDAQYAFGDFNGDGSTDFISSVDSDFDVFFANNAREIDLPNLDLFSSDTATTSKAVVESAVSRVEAEQANIGAQLSRFEIASNQLSSRSTELEAAESKIRDADIAAETAELTKRQILSESIIAMLAQANQQPEIALDLLLRNS